MSLTHVTVWRAINGIIQEISDMIHAQGTQNILRREREELQSECETTYCKPMQRNGRKKGAGLVGPRIVKKTQLFSPYDQFNSVDLSL